MTLRRSAVALSGLTLSATFWAPAAAHGAVLTATFDDEPDGFIGTSFTDGGITFTNALNGGGGASPFGIDDGKGIPVPNFSTPNSLLIDGAATGDITYSLFTQFNFAPASGGLATKASLYLLFLNRSASVQTLTLEGFLAGVQTGSVAFPLPANTGDYETGMLLSLPTGAYDSFAVVSSAPQTVYGSFDNVSVTTAVPEPAVAGLLAMAGSAGLFRRRRR